MRESLAHLWNLNFLNMIKYVTAHFVYSVGNFQKTIRRPGHMTISRLFIYFRFESWTYVSRKYECFRDGVIMLCTNNQVLYNVCSYDSYDMAKSISNSTHSVYLRDLGTLGSVVCLSAHIIMNKSMKIWITIGDLCLFYNH